MGIAFDKRDTYGVLGTFVLWLLSHSAIVESAKPRRSLWFLSDTVSSRPGDHRTINSTPRSLLFASSDVTGLVFSR